MRIFLVSLLYLSAQALIAEDSHFNELVFQASTSPAAQIAYTRNLLFPLLQGNTPMTESNNIVLRLGAELSPISLNGVTEAVWTPIAFFYLTTGGKIGSGWNLRFSGRDIRGIGFNRPDAAGNAEHSGSPFDGLLWRTHIGGALQADLAALYPGEWHHLVARSYHEISYRGYSRASPGESWYFEIDDGENINGFNYYGNFLLGYEMPLFLDLVALYAEADLYLNDTPNRTIWGDNMIRWKFALLTNFAVTKQLGVTRATQFKTLRNFNESNWEDLYYRNRTVDKSSPYRLVFNRVGVIMTYIF
jgi:hypothetical protein